MYYDERTVGGKDLGLGSGLTVMPQLRSQVKERVQLLTCTLTDCPPFVLIDGPGGQIQQTNRFKRIWIRKTIYWEPIADGVGDARPKNEVSSLGPIAGSPNIESDGGEDEEMMDPLTVTANKSLDIVRFFTSGSLVFEVVFQSSGLPEVCQV